MIRLYILCLWDKMYKIISIEGNIGSGKTTLLHHLKIFCKDEKNIFFLGEPIDDWNSIRDKKGHSMIQKFYNDQGTYAFSFQIMAYLSRLRRLKEIIDRHRDDNIIIITERSLYTDKYIFAKMLYHQGKLEDVEHQIYLQLFDQFSDEYPLSDIIYVRTDPIICSARIQKRGRAGEEDIPLDYLVECGQYHDEYVKAKMKFIYAVHIIDGNIDIELNKPILNSWVHRIKGIIGLDRSEPSP